MEELKENVEKIAPVSKPTIVEAPKAEKPKSTSRRDNGKRKYVFKKGTYWEIGENNSLKKYVKDSVIKLTIEEASKSCFNGKLLEL